ncbi:uncharacterized protein LOC110929700 [Helianthus annuus]|uniref:uncharacterized protein LOC110929700 n=1 Tax=Helianthus annuus TaxID=4232 RepID=UPI000B9031B1|nr:uncharacterized protein LOC110929700 [Helianthus annuus]
MEARRRRSRHPSTVVQGGDSRDSAAAATFSDGSGGSDQKLRVLVQGGCRHGSRFQMQAQARDANSLKVWCDSVRFQFRTKSVNEVSRLTRVNLVWARVNSVNRRVNWSKQAYPVNSVCFGQQWSTAGQQWSSWVRVKH